LITSTTIAFILFAFAAGLMVSAITTYAQEGVNVSTTTNGTQEVPTLTSAIELNIQSLTALIAAIIALAGLIVKSGILDTYIDKKKQDQFIMDAEMNFATMKKALEDKVLTKFVLEQITPLIPEQDRAKVMTVATNVNEQMNKTTEQLQFYHDRLKDRVGQKTMDRINPDNNTALPRERRNIANELGPIPQRIGDKVSMTTRGDDSF
jgi:cobalamin biosynthesis protein CbiD